MEPCRGSDSGSNPDSGALSSTWFGERSFSEAGKKCKLQCKLELHHSSISSLTLQFTNQDLYAYLEWRVTGLDKKSANWMKKAAEILWSCTRGIISKATTDAVRETVLTKYKCEYAKRKVLNFAKGFLKYLTKTTFDTRFLAFELFLEKPKRLKERKLITSRIVTRKDTENVLATIKRAEHNNEIDHYRSHQFTAFVLFGAYTGQRSYSTIKRLTVGQFKEALRIEKPILHVQSDQDKIRMAHYRPLHPQVIKAILPLVDGRMDDEPMFTHLVFERWVKFKKIQLTRSDFHFVLGDLRKFAEQYGDIIQWEQSNRAYILTHGVSGVEWAHYRHPLLEYVYDVYIRYWKGVHLSEFCMKPDLKIDSMFSNRYFC